MNNNPEKVIDEIKYGNEKVLTKVYNKVYRGIIHYCYTVGIKENEAKECVQDAFEVFYRQVLNNDIKLTCAVDTYVISIAKRILLANNRVRLKIEYDESTEPDSIIDDQEIDETELATEQDQVFYSEFDKLGDDCKKVLTHTFNGLNIKEVTQKMNYSSEKFTKTKRARCRKYLIERIKENPWYKLNYANTTHSNTFQKT